MATTSASIIDDQDIAAGRNGQEVASSARLVSGPWPVTGDVTEERTVHHRLGGHRTKIAPPWALTMP